MDNRWSQLSMSEKAQLLGIYASKGYTDLASIISHYNSFAKGGQINTDGPEDPPTPVQYVNPKGSTYPSYNPPYSDVDDTTWLKWWFNNRQNQLRNNRTESLPNFIPYTEQAPIEFKNIGPAFTGGQSFFRFGNDRSKDRIEIYPYAQTMDKAGKRTIFHEKVHILSHANNEAAYSGDNSLLQDKFESSPLMRIYGYTKDNKYLLPIYKKDDYFDDKGEIYSRLMEFRRANKLLPTDYQDKKKIDEWRNSGLLKIFDLDRYDDNFLLYLFNKLAQNNSSSQDAAHYAALGGHLSYNGGTDESKEDKNYLLDLLRINFKST